MEDKLEALRSDAVFFARNVLGFEPFPYQEQLLRDPSKRIVACMGRQTGKSTTIAGKAVWFAAAHPGMTTLVVSATMRQSMLMMDKILAGIDGSAVLKRSVAYRARTRVRFFNGSWIIALPCGRYGHTLRGHTAHLIILDEAAFIPEDVVANVVLPMVSTTDGWVWMISTPWDKDHIFFKAFSDTGEWSVYHLPSSVNPLIKPGFLEEQRRLIGEERFQMEYEAAFVDDARSYFPMSLLRNCVGESVFQGESGGLFGGYDPGGKQDYAAFTVVRRMGDRFGVEYVRAEKGLSYTDFDAMLLDYHKAYGLTGICVDATGIGAPIVEHLTDLGLPVEGLTLTDRVKEELLGNLKILLEQKRIVLPQDPMLLSHLNCIEFERSRMGGFRFTHRRDTHDDLGYALALACWAARGGVRGSVATF